MDQTQHSAKYFIDKAFLDFTQVLKKQGVTEIELASIVFRGHTVDEPVKELRSLQNIAKRAIGEEVRDMVRARSNSGMTKSKIAKELEIPESTVRNIINRL